MKVSVHDIPDWRMELERRLGHLICKCLHPVPLSLSPWDAHECARCGKKVV